MTYSLSTREQLALIAVRAATGVEGVVGMHAQPGGVHTTQAGAERVGGVSVVAGHGEGFDVTLCLSALPVPLHPLAARVRSAVRSRAQIAGLSAAVGVVDVRFDAVVDSPSVARA